VRDEIFPHQREQVEPKSLARLSQRKLKLGLNDRSIGKCTGFLFGTNETMRHAVNPWDEIVDPRVHIFLAVGTWRSRDDGHS
jgi:hypothetical protein